MERCHAFTKAGTQCKNTEGLFGGLIPCSTGRVYCDSHSHLVVSMPKNFIKKEKRNPKTTTKQGYSKEDNFVCSDDDCD